MKEKIIENVIEYVKCGDYYIPDLKMPKNKYNIGIYGRLHKKFIEENHKGFYISLLLQGKLYEYLYKIDCEAHNMLNSLIPKLVEQQGITEELKAENQLKWVGMMNNVNAQAEEIVYSEIVYVRREI